MASHWDDEADVVIVGYGGAGASAAIAAHDGGAKVSIIEKDDGGGNTKLATRTFISPENSAAAQQHIQALSSGTLDQQTLDSCLHWMSQNNDFIRKLGGEVEICPPGATFPRKSCSRRTDFNFSTELPDKVIVLGHPVKTRIQRLLVQRTG